MSTHLEFRDQLEAGLRSEADGELSRRVLADGRRLLLLLAALMRGTRLYQADNDALARPVEELAAVLGGLVEAAGALRLVLVEGQAYVNDVRLKPRGPEEAAIGELRGALERHGSGGVTFNRALSRSEWVAFAIALGGAAGEPPLAALRARLANWAIEAWGPFRFELQRGLPQVEDHAQLCARAGRAARRALAQLERGRPPGILPVRRAVIGLLEALRVEPEQAALAPFAGRPGSSERHLVAVCRLSLMLGRAVGLGDAVLADLGVAALLHDIGYLVAGDVARHPRAGARVLLRQRGFGEATARRVRAVLEHATDEADAPARPSLFARIIHIAEHYDLLAAPRRDEPPRCSPARALACLWAGRGTRYDPVLLAVFAGQLGLYPPGTVLELTDGSRAVVLARTCDRDNWAQPLVRLVQTAEGTAAPGGRDIDLRWRRRVSVRRVVEPALLSPDTAAACDAVLRPREPGWAA